MHPLPTSTLHVTSTRLMWQAANWWRQLLFESATRLRGTKLVTAQTASVESETKTLKSACWNWASSGNLSLVSLDRFYTWRRSNAVTVSPAFIGDCPFIILKFMDWEQHERWWGEIASCVTKKHSWLIMWLSPISASSAAWPMRQIYTTVHFAKARPLLDMLLDDN